MPLADLADSPALALLCRFSVGGVFLVYGLAKLRQLSAFVDGAVEWDVLPPAFVRPLARALPFVEVGLGGALLLGVVVREAALAAEVVLGIFAVAVIVNLLRGRRTPCFCAGAASYERVGFATLLRILVLAGLGAVVAMSPVHPTMPLAHAADTALAVLGAALIGGLLALLPALDVAFRDALTAERARSASRTTSRRPLATDPGAT